MGKINKAAGLLSLIAMFGPRMQSRSRPEKESRTAEDIHARREKQAQKLARRAARNKP